MIRVIGGYLFPAVPKSFRDVRGYSQAAANRGKLFSNAILEKRALDLIFGSRSYTAFTSREKRLVDLYQERVFRVSCGCVVLPNTKMDLEQIDLNYLLNQKK